MLNAIINFFKSLNNNSHPGEIAHAASIGVLLGFLPKDNAIWYILFIFFLFVRINKAVYLLVILGIGTFAFSLDNLFDKIGYAVLTFEKLTPISSSLLETPFVAFTNFNNTIVMGSLVFGILAYFPVYLLARLFVKLWRSTLAPKISSLKIWQAIKKLPFVNKIFSVSEKISEVTKR